MTDRVSDSIVVAADPDTVMDVIADFPAYPQWQDEVEHVEVLDTDEYGWGRRVRFALDAKAFTARYVLEYDYTDTSMSWQLVESDQLSRLTGSYVLDPTDGGTRVTYELDVVPRMRLPSLVRRTAARRIVTTALAGLKERVESRRK